MEKRIACFALLTVVLLSLFAGCASQRPREELVSSVESPDGAHIMKVYKNSGSATVDFSTTISILTVDTSNERNIYFHYHEKAPDEAVWIDNETVSINGIELNISNDYYESFDYKD